MVVELDGYGAVNEPLWADEVDGADRVVEDEMDKKEFPVVADTLTQTNNGKGKRRYSRDYTRKVSEIVAPNMAENNEFRLAASLSR